MRQIVSDASVAHGIMRRLSVIGSRHHASEIRGRGLRCRIKGHCIWSCSSFEGQPVIDEDRPVRELHFLDVDERVRAVFSVSSVTVNAPSALCGWYSSRNAPRIRLCQYPGAARRTDCRCSGQMIITLPAPERVVPLVAEEYIVTGAAVDGVVTEATEYLVVAPSAEDSVAALQANQEV